MIFDIRAADAAARRFAAIAQRLFSAYRPMPTRRRYFADISSSRHVIFRHLLPAIFILMPISPAAAHHDSHADATSRRRPYAYAIAAAGCRHIFFRHYFFAAACGKEFDLKARGEALPLDYFHATPCCHTLSFRATPIFFSLSSFAQVFRFLFFCSCSPQFQPTPTSFRSPFLRYMSSRKRSCCIFFFF